MNEIIILRGPAGVGKSTVGKALKKKLGDALLFNIDMICSDMLGAHPKRSKARHEAYELCYFAAKKAQKGNLIFERLFLEQKDIDDLKGVFSDQKYRLSIITLKASLSKLIKQDSARTGPLGAEDIKRLHNLFTNSNVKNTGKIISMRNKRVEKIVSEIIDYLNKGV